MMKITTRFILALCLSLQSLCAMDVESVQGGSGDQSSTPITQEGVSLISALCEKASLKNHAIVHSIVPNSKNAERVIFFDAELQDGKKGAFVAKIFREQRDYCLENTRFQFPANLHGKSYLEWLNIYRENNTTRLPIITEYIGGYGLQGKGVIIFRKAEGEGVEDLLHKASKGEISNEEIVDIFTDMGRQQGRLTALFYKESGENAMTLVHGDATSRNFLYDTSKKQLYWIDTDTVMFKSFEQYSVENIFFGDLGSVLSGGNDKPLKDFMAVCVDMNCNNIKDSEIANDINSLKRRLLIRKSVYCGYAEGLNEVFSDLGSRIIEQYNRQFEQKLYENESAKFCVDLCQQHRPSIHFSLEHLDTFKIEL